MGNEAFSKLDDFCREHMETMSSTMLRMMGPLKKVEEGITSATQGVRQFVSQTVHRSIGLVWLVTCRTSHQNKWPCMNIYRKDRPIFGNAGVRIFSSMSVVL